MRHKARHGHNPFTTQRPLGEHLGLPFFPSSEEEEEEEGGKERTAEVEAALGRRRRAGAAGRCRGPSGGTGRVETSVRLSLLRCSGGGRAFAGEGLSGLSHSHSTPAARMQTGEPKPVHHSSSWLEPARHLPLGRAFHPTLAPAEGTSSPR